MRLVDADALKAYIEDYACRPCKEYAADRDGVRCNFCSFQFCLDGIDQHSVQRTGKSNDLISRQAALDALEWKWAGKAAIDAIKNLPSAQPDGWLEQNKDKILQAGMEGREIDFHIGGRLFAIREKAQ